MFKKNHEKRLLNFFEEAYGKELPKTDEDMFCLLTGIIIAKNTCQMSYKLTKLRFEHFPPGASIHSLIRHEEKTRIRLYDEAYELVSCYIAEVKGLKREGQKFRDWFAEMHEQFKENEDTYTKKSKEESNRIINVVFKHLMSDLYSGS